MNKKPNILIIAPLPPPVHGSAMVSRYIRESVVLGESFVMDFVNLSTSRKMDEIGKTSLHKLFRFAGAYFRLLGKLMRHRYDLCYLAITCHGIGFLKDAPFVWLCKLFGRKVVIHQHNKGMSADVHRWPYRWLLPMTYRHATVILLSWRLYPDVADVVRKEQVRICANGIPPLEASSRTKSSASRLDGAKNLDVSSGCIRILFLSNLMVSKGVFVLLDACKVLKDKGYAFVCDFVGSETKEIPRSRFEEEVKRRDLQREVVFHGPLYGERKQDFFHRADIFVQPTSDDCFPLTILEAMSSGLPVVATDEGAISDMVIEGKTGFLCRKEDVSSLVKAIEKLLVNKELRKQMGDKARFWYKERFTQDAFERRLSEVLSDILN